MADRGPFTWSPIQLNTERVIFDTSCLECASETHAGYVCTTKGSVVRIELDGHLKASTRAAFSSWQLSAFAGISNSSSCGEGIPAWVSHVEKHESSRGFLSHQFSHCLLVALDLDSILGCCPWVAPSWFPYSSWDGVSAD
jgi:hypothetical protein